MLHALYVMLYCLNIHLANLSPSTCSTSCLHPPAVHPEAIDATTIKTAALQTDGAAGPSGIDARGWRRLCASFHSASIDLCHSLALLARRLCTEHVSPDGLATVLGCRLIALKSRSSPHWHWGDSSTYRSQGSIVSYWRGYPRGSWFYSTLFRADLWHRGSCACHERGIS